MTGMSDPERLDSWKEIARHLRRDVTTAIRWERDRGRNGPAAPVFP